ncbi:MAG: hypothetical protein L6R38_000488 [Xanthoria sp. 2 TBL-2021]|nr:MAG: hypothetical protein L6R38_000488 [Xanthoria sp. 2 TBL-2021]
MSSPSSSGVLSTPLGTLKILLRSFSDQLSNLTPNKTSISNPPNALAILHDSTSVLRAQGTKLSLLLLNKPFTPSAIASILASISAECLPGLRTVYEICSPDVYGNVTQNEVRNQLRDLVSVITNLVDDIEGMAEYAEMDAPEGLKEFKDYVGKREEILQVTGQVWSVCDRMLATAKVGIVGVAMDKAKEWEALIKDAIDELEGWDPDADDDFDMDFDSEPEEGRSGQVISREVVNEQQKGIDGVQENEMKHPSNGNDTELQSTSQTPLTEHPQTTDVHAAKAKVLKVLKLIKMLYPALRKRRISTYPPFTRLNPTSSLHPWHQVKQFSDMLAFCEDFSTATDDLADVLYERAPNLVQAKMELITTMACRCVDGVKKGWNEEEDEFTEWSGKWIARVKEVGGGIPEEELELSQKYQGLRLD